MGYVPPTNVQFTEQGRSDYDPMAYDLTLRFNQPMEPLDTCQTMENNLMSRLGHVLEEKLTEVSRWQAMALADHSVLMESQVEQVKSIHASEPAATSSPGKLLKNPTGKKTP